MIKLPAQDSLERQPPSLVAQGRTPSPRCQAMARPLLLAAACCGAALGGAPAAGAVAALPPSAAQLANAAAGVPQPSAAQLSGALAHGFTAFVCYGICSFTGCQWNTALSPASAFAPPDAGPDTEQWMRVYRDMGATQACLTVRHIDGFALWPTATTNYSVAASPWRGGKGDLVADFVASARKFGISPCFYFIAGFDVAANHSGVSGPTYLDNQVKALTELLTNYGQIDRLWFDASSDSTGARAHAHSMRKRKSTRCARANAYRKCLSTPLAELRHRLLPARDARVSLLPRRQHRVDAFACLPGLAGADRYSASAQPVDSHRAGARRLPGERRERRRHLPAVPRERPARVLLLMHKGLAALRRRRLSRAGERLQHAESGRVLKATRAARAHNLLRTARAHTTPSARTRIFCPLNRCRALPPSVVRRRQVTIGSGRLGTPS